MKQFATPKSSLRIAITLVVSAHIVVFTAVPPSLVSAQTPDVIDLEPFLGKGMASHTFAPPTSTNAEQTSLSAATSTSIDQVTFTEGPTSEVDIWTQVSELRTRLQIQESELASLRRSSSTNAVHARSGILPNWFATYESVLVAPMQSNSTGLIVETDTGYSHVGFPWEMKYSPRVQLGREASNDTLGWRVRFWEFKHNESFDANDANGLIPTGNEGVVGYLSEFGDITTGLAFIQEGTFRSSIRTDVIDVELQRNIVRPLDLYAGLRYAKIAQGYAANTDQGIVNAQSEFRGIGPTVALRLSHILPLETLSLFANLRGSMLFGSKSFSVVDDANSITQSIGDIDLRSGTDSADTLAGNTEMQLGLQYAPSDYFNISVAIESMYFANVGGPNPTAAFTGPDGGINGDGPMDDGLGFLGLTVGTELRW